MQALQLLSCRGLSFFCFLIFFVTHVGSAIFFYNRGGSCFSALVFFIPLVCRTILFKMSSILAHFGSLCFLYGFCFLRFGQIFGNARMIISIRGGTGGSFIGDILNSYYVSLLFSLFKNSGVVKLKRLEFGSLKLPHLI